jgi:hypothetical protein
MAKITQSGQPMVNVRADRHAYFDRLVVDVQAGGATGYFVRYVDTVARDRSGFKVPLRGDERLAVTVVALLSTTLTGRPTVRQTHASWSTSPAGRPSVRSRGPVLPKDSRRLSSGFGPGCRSAWSSCKPRGAGSRFVIDVAHRW